MPLELTFLVLWFLTQVLFQHLSSCLPGRFYRGIVTVIIHDIQVMNPYGCHPSVRSMFGHAPTSVLWWHLTAPSTTGNFGLPLYTVVQRGGALTGSSYRPSLHTRHFHIPSFLCPAGFPGQGLPISLGRFPASSAQSPTWLATAWFTLSHSGLQVRLQVSRRSASPSDPTSRWRPRLGSLGCASTPRGGLSPPWNYAFRAPNTFLLLYRCRCS